MFERLEDRWLLANWSGDIPDGTVWTNTEVQRIVGSVRVPAGATLTIQPGTIVKVNEFSGFNIRVAGTLVAAGTASQPIVFTALRDDTGLDGLLNTADDQDTNGNGPSTASNGDWNRIEFMPGSSGNLLDHVQVRFGGAGSDAEVIVDSAGLTMTNSLLRHSSSSGIRIQASNPTLTGNTFHQNSVAAVSMDLASNPAISGVTVTNNGANALVLDSGALVGDGFWNDPDIVYRLTGDVTVPAGNTLTVSAGQTVKFRAFSGDDLIVDGRLLADGTPELPIIFTSERDDSAGGDTNNNGDTAGNNGDWDAIHLRSGSGGHLLDHVEVRYGGASSEAGELIASVPMTLTNSTIQNSGTAGVRLQTSDSTLTGNTFQNNSTAPISMDLASNPVISGSVVAGNGSNALILDSGDLVGNGFWNDPDIVYLLTGDVTVPAGSTLTVGAGQVIKFRTFVSEDLFVDGRLVADGTPELPIVFTSERDDSAGGDTNNNGNTAGNNGDWDAIHLRTGSSGHLLDYVEVRYGGESNEAGELITSVPMTLTNSTIRNSGTAGVRLQTSDSTLTNNTFQNNSTAPISMDLASNPVISGVVIAGNGSNALILDSGSLVGNGFWDDPDIVYRLTGDVTVPAESTLTVGAGQVVKFRTFVGQDLFVDGKLLADGTSDLPIVFTSERDDSVGGDTDNNGGTAGGNGDWDAIHLRSGSSGHLLDHVEVRYGGASSRAGELIASVPMTLTNSLLRNSATSGVRLQTSNSTLTNNTFQSNSTAAISMDLASNPMIGGVTLTNNRYNALILDPGDLVGNGFWDDPDIVYWLSGDVTVPAGSTLTVGAGQVVKFRTFVGEDLFVDGKLLADGAAAQPIIFTSDRDDSAGGDTDNNGGTEANNGDWDAIHFRSGSSGHLLDYVEVRYGGASSKAGELIASVPVTMTNSILRNSGTSGVRLETSDSTLTNNTFQSNSTAAISMDLASNPVISGVTVTKNRSNALILDPGSLVGNGFWDDPDIVYRLSGDVTVPAGSTLTVAAGQVVKFRMFAGDDLFVDGKLLADGTSTQPIIFTSERDDSRGGDTNNDGPSGGHNGDWDAIHLRSGSSGHLLDHVEVWYGGASSELGELIASVPMTLTNSTVRDSGSSGVRLQTSDSTLADNTFQNNGTAAISMDLASNPTISGIVAAGNGSNALILDAGELVGNGFWDDADIVYRLTGDVTVPVGSALTIGAGQIVKFRSFAGDDLLVNGTLRANGTATQPIILTSDRDDSAGGDTNQNGPTTGGNGDWSSLQLNASSTDSQLNHVELRFGGGGRAAMLLVDGSSLAVNSSVVRNSSSHAILVRTNGTGNVTNSLIFGNSDTGLRAESGSVVTAVNNTIDGNYRGAAADGAGTQLGLVNNLLTFHARSGVFVAGGGTVNASYNDAFNPSAGSGNYEGLDDQTDLNGNISTDPLYIHRDNRLYGLRARSGAIDIGTSTGTPATDFAGNARFDDPGVANLGEGVSPFFDMGALERQNVSDPLNLTIENPAVNDALVRIGDQVTVSWTVRSTGVIAVEGAWTDSVFVSRDAVWDLGDSLVATVPHSGELAADATYDAQAAITIPPQTHGQLFFIIRTDSRRAQREAVETDNEAVVWTTLDIPELILDVPFNAQFTAPGQSQYFRVQVPVNRSLVLTLDSAATTGSTELFIREDDIPSRTSFDARSAQPSSPDQQILLPRAERTTYYVLAQAGFDATSASAYSLMAEQPGFDVFSFSPQQGGNSGTVSVRVAVTDLTSYTRIELIGEDGTIITPIESSVLDPSNLLVTFDLNGTTPGLYDLRVVSQQEVLDVDPDSGDVFLRTQTDGDVIIPDGFRITEEKGQGLVTRLYLPSAVRFARVFPFQVEVANEGTTNIAVPILRAFSSNGTPLSKSPNVRAGDGSEIQIVVLGDKQRGFLAPGERVLVTLYGLANKEPRSEITLETLPASADPLNLASFEQSYRDTSTAEEWATTWANFQSLVGDSFGTLHAAMRQVVEDMVVPADVRFVTGSEILFQLLGLARAGVTNLGGAPRLDGPASEQEADNPSARDSAGGEGSISPAAARPISDFCRTGIDAAALDQIEHDILNKTFKLGLSLPSSVKLAFGSYVWDEVYAKFLNSTRESPTPELIFKDGSPIVEGTAGVFGTGFKYDEYTKKMVQGMLGRAIDGVKKMLASGALKKNDLPTSFQIDDPRLIPTKFLEFDEKHFIFANPNSIAGNLAGGVGGTDARNDSRMVRGTVNVRKQLGLFSNKTQYIELNIYLEITVKDGFDFCPGDPGTSEEQEATIPLSMLEANNRAHDVIYTVSFNALPETGYILAAELPEDFDVEKPDPQPPNPDCPQGTGEGGAKCDSTTSTSRTVRSFDPNDKTGPAGFGTQQFVQSGTLPYLIQFENDPNQGATAPAQEVFVTDTLDADLDLTTVEFTSFGFDNRVYTVPPGLNAYETTIDLRPEGDELLVAVTLELNPQTRELKATYRSLDPLTGLLPSDPNAGFLPVNDKLLHNGEGFVTYVVRPQEGLATGIAITNQASIVFDVNAPLLTPTTLHTIDDGAPTSHVSPLPATSNATFPITWTGSDDAAGSGIATYDVYYSVNGGSVVLFRDDTTDTSATFTGAVGNTYRFYSLAVDNVGHAEQPPATPDTETTVVIKPWQNPRDPLDVTDDGNVVPIDVLVVINEINGRKFSDPITGKLNERTADATFYFDVNGDDFATPIDALIVINFLNAKVGEGESDGSPDGLLERYGEGSLRRGAILPNSNQDSLEDLAVSLDDYPCIHSRTSLGRAERDAIFANLTSDDGLLRPRFKSHVTKASHPMRQARTTP